MTFVEFKKDDLDAVDGLDGAIDLVVSPDGEHDYGVGQNDDALVVFTRNSTTGRLAFVEFQKDGVAGLNGIPPVTISADGKHVYVTGTFVDTRKMLLIK